MTGAETLAAYEARWSLPRVTARAARLTAFPPCALCGCHVNGCDCDPDEAQAAALVALMNRDGGRA